MRRAGSRAVGLHLPGLSVIGKIGGLAALVGDRAAQWVSNAVERRLRTENFIVANQTPYREIHRNGLLGVRHYAPLADAQIAVGKRTIPVQQKWPCGSR